MPQLSDYPRYATHILSGMRARMEAEAAERRRSDLAPFVDRKRSLGVLDIGNGRLRPQYAILRGAGHRVVGMDFVNRPQLNRRELAYKVMRQIYAAQLGLPKSAMQPDALVGADVGCMPLASESFDLATSIAAFEHFLDIPAVISELYRVLRPGGVAWVLIHLFTSPSGGHNLSFTEYPLRTLPSGVQPWDHLRERKLPFTVPLNQWRKQQYLDTFAQRFEVLSSYCFMREGQQWLTPENLAALPQYTEDELTCGALVIVARKPGAAPV